MMSLPGESNFRYALLKRVSIGYSACACVTIGVRGVLRGVCHVTQVFTRHQISESRATLPPPSVLARWVWWEGVNINNSVDMPTDGVTAQGSGQEHNRWVQVTDHVTMGSGFVSRGAGCPCVCERGRDPSPRHRCPSLLSASGAQSTGRSGQQAAPCGYRTANRQP